MNSHIFDTLSDDQKKFIKESDDYDKVAVIAVPGSGKTYLTACKLVDLLEKWQSNTNGVAALSFTNTAKNEIEKTFNKLSENKKEISFPHYVGTIDSFVNRHIFLPHGHHIMGCKKRPRLVGGEYGNLDRLGYYASWFDKIAFTDESEQNLFFLQNYPRPRNDTRTNQGLISTKKRLIKGGFANQYDANFYALKILRQYPKVAQIIARRFPVLIVDEAQDTTELHIKIIEELEKHGLQKVIFIGDTDQAIFEWNTADPNSYMHKVENYKHFYLANNRRSSKRICDFYKILSSVSNIKAVNDEVKEFSFEPRIISYNDIESVLAEFKNINTSLDLSVSPDNTAILCRTKSLVKDVKKILSDTDVQNDDDSFLRGVWSSNATSSVILMAGIKDIYSNGQFSNAFEKICRAVIEIEENRVLTASDLRDLSSQYNLFQLRIDIYQAIMYAKDYLDRPLPEWVDIINGAFSSVSVNLENFKLEVKSTVSISAREYIGDDSGNENLPVRVGTIHSAKGESIDSVLVCISQNGGRKLYKTIINEWHNSSDQYMSEELRTVYVGLTRARKVLVFAVPEQDLELWENLLLTPSG